MINPWVIDESASLRDSEGSPLLWNRNHSRFRYQNFREMSLKTYSATGKPRNHHSQALIWVLSNLLGNCIRYSSAL